MQQSRNLYNARKCDKGIPSALSMIGLLLSVRSLTNKWRARLVPAAAVTPAPQVATMFIGSKASVAGSINFLWNCSAQLNNVQERLLNLRPGGGRGILGGTVKCNNPWRTANGEGIYLERFWRSGTKARGAKRIRYPSSPSCKRCELGGAYSSRMCNAQTKVLSSPPGKYSRKAET